MRAQISKTLVDSITPPTRGRATVWDTKVPRFGLRLTAAGARTYIIKYRVGRRQRLLTIGGAGAPWAPEQARQRARELLRRVGVGEDPAAAKAGTRTAPTVAALLDRFLAEHAHAKLKPSTTREYARMTATILRPGLGARPVAAVTREDVARLHHRYRETPYQANRLLALMGKLFTLAERWAMRPDGSNPARNVEKFREAKRTRRLSIEELGRLGAALAVAEAGSPIAVAAIRLLLFTGCRSGEILGARWTEVDHGRGVLRLLDAKRGARDVLLSAPARAVLATLPRVEGCLYILPGHRRGRPLVNLQRPWQAVTGTAGLAGLRLHDLRHVYGSVGVDSGLSLPVVGKLLGHTLPSSTQRYSHVEDPVRAASELVAGTIAAALRGTDAPVSE